MSWFLFALVATVSWGGADLFYKKGTDDHDRYSHLRIAVWVGLVMGVCSFALLPFSESFFSVGSLVVNAGKYTPASFSYIISMVIGYAGMRYLEISIISPVQNASGALSAIFLVFWFVFTGKMVSIKDEFSVLDILGTLVIIVGVIMLATVEQRLSRDETQQKNRKYRTGALAMIFPLLYCLFDTIGTTADGIILSEETGLGLSEIDVLILYGLTFFAIGVIAWIYMLIREKKPYNPFARRELTKGVAACAEEFGQVFYVYAMTKNPVLAAPMIASYCIVSVLLSRVFLKEKLERSQVIFVITVIIGIVLLGISEGISELG